MSTTASSASDGGELKDWVFERAFALRLCEAVGTPVALGQYLRVSSDPKDACTFSVDPSNYQEPKQFAEDYQVAEILKKSHNIPGVGLADRQMKALQKFKAAEEHNALTNNRLWGDTLPPWFGEFSYHVLRILGPLDTRALNSISELGKFGPGVNVGVRGDGLVPSIKYDTRPVCTTELQPLLPAIMPAMVGLLNTGVEPKVAQGNSHFTVPKNWEIERCAAKEPLWDSYLQLGIGQYIAKRLKRFGIDLRDQRLNQTLASLAMDWELATIDLSSASDLMSRSLVLLALCYNQDEHGKRWHHLLDLARSKIMKIDGEHVGLEMFSSMGNGFTFPLETVLFSAVIRSVVPSDEWSLCTAYGDDIIAPQRHAATIVERLEYLGFKVNSKKTCLAGAFFESCGTDWFNGCNVRPFYLHKDPKSPVPYALQAANALRAWCLRVYGELPERYFTLWKWCKGQVPVSWRNPVPKELGDVGLHTSLSEGESAGCHLASQDVRYPGWEGHVVSIAKVRPVFADRRTPGVLLAGLSSLQDLSVETQPLWLDLPPLSRGLEPLRGLYGRVRTEQVVVLWKDDFRWGQ